MPSDSNIAYFNNIIASVAAPRSSFMSLGGYIGSSNSQSSISDFIENKTKSVGKLFSLSMLQSPHPNTKLMHAMIRKLSCDLTKFGKWVGIKLCLVKKLAGHILIKYK